MGVRTAVTERLWHVGGLGQEMVATEEAIATAKLAEGEDCTVGGGTSGGADHTGTIVIATQPAASMPVSLPLAAGANVTPGRQLSRAREAISALMGARPAHSWRRQCSRHHHRYR
jgi:hypothetical protein